MKKMLCLLLLCALLLSLCACGKTTEQDQSPVTMCVSMGNGEAYFTQLAALIKRDLDIDIEFVYQHSADTTSLTRLYFAHNDLPADIVFTSSKTDDALLKDSCVDLLSRSSVTSLYTATTIDACTTEEGAVYQLPVSSRLIGITYNETLLREMGWEVPESFDDMVELKALCDEAGIKFAVTDGAATGHGFNWLFHLMGSQWLSTPDGTDWLEGFQAGTRSVDDFAEQCDYFKRWTEAGLWGVFHTEDWSGNTEFMKTRALFWFGLVNTATGYDGPEYDDEGNETGRELHDTYKSIPWISEDGSNNCYTYYDNCWVYVNKELEAPEEAEKLEKVFQILSYMAGDEATRLVSEMGLDTYVSVTDYNMEDDRLYAASRDDISTGFLQPWYYNEFDQDSIVFTGEVINRYIAGEGSFEDIFTTLDEYNQKQLNSEIEVLADFPDGLDYEGTAKLVAVSAAAAINQTLAENGRDEQVDVALVPYTPGANLLPAWRGAAVCNTTVYAGAMDAAQANLVFPNGVTNPCAIYMTGAEILALTESGYDPSDRFIDADTGESTFDAEQYGPYPYVCLVKDGAELVADETYLVALNDRFVTDAQYNAFNEEGRVITDLENLYTLRQGLDLFAAEHPQITAADLTL